MKKLFQKKQYKIITRSSTKQFYRDYKLPLSASLLFSLVLLVVIFVRTYEQSILAATLENKKNRSQDYAALLSSDASRAFNSTAVTPADVSTNPKTTGSEKSDSASTASQVFIVTPNATPSSSGTTPSGTQTTTTSGTGTPPTAPPPVQPIPLLFDASVKNLSKNSGYSSVCESNNGISDCNKTYSFSAVIEATNERVTEETVGYTWKLDDRDQGSGSYKAPRGTTRTTVNKQIKIPCNFRSDVRRYIVSIDLTTPRPDRTTLEFDHNCDGLLH